MLGAIVFDFDGIIVDTEPFHHRAFMEILEPLGISCTWEEYLERYAGFDDRDAFRDFFGSAGRALDDGRLKDLIGTKARAFERIVAAGVTPYPGVVELVRSLAGDLPLGLCSGALPSDIQPILAHLGLTDCFSSVVTAADVPASKPDPACYRLVVEKLAARFPDRKIGPGTCLAIEDTPTGIAAARGAGLRVLAVTNNYPAERLRGEGCVVRSSLEGLTLAELERLAG